MKQTAIEVYQQTGFAAAKPQLPKYLCRKPRVHAFNALQFDDYGILYGDGESRFTNHPPAIPKGEGDLTLANSDRSARVQHSPTCRAGRHPESMKMNHLSIAFLS
jgi:hypothetical protein